nr:tRNA dihydrouridine synthase DusB [uncultured Desulfuromonas sp.]
MCITPLKIGSLSLDNNLILAPMAGITNSPYRQIAMEAGAALTYSEMVSGNGLIRDGLRTLELLKRAAIETPFAVQLFGDDPQVLAEATHIASRYGELIDLNMGCPVKKVIRSGAGSALMREPEKVQKIIAAMRKATPLPLTVKIRSGWTLDEINYPLIGRICQEEGADAIILHPRTRCQGFGGHSSWEHIGELKRQLSIPVIGSGDVKSANDAFTMFQETSCDGIMIGRGSYGNPWLFSDILKQSRGEKIVPPTREQRLATARHHLDLYSDEFGERKTLLDMRKHLCWYSRGLSGATEFRANINRCETLNEIRELCFHFFSQESH